MSGFISVVFAYACSVRGEEYNPSYLDGEMKYIILFSLGGCITLIVTIVVFISVFISVWIDEHKPKSRLFTKFIYWLANIGVKKDGDDR